MREIYIWLNNKVRVSVGFLFFIALFMIEKILFNKDFPVY